MDESRPTNATPAPLRELLLSLPGEGVDITEADGETVVRFRAQYGRLKRYVRLAIPAIGMMLMIVGGGSLFNDIDGPPAFPLRAMVLFASMIVAGVFLIMPAFWMLFAYANRPCLFLSDNRFRIGRGDNSIEIPRDEFHSVAIQRQKPDWQLKANLHWPWERGDAGGIVVVTTSGKIEFLKNWHESVTVWTAQLLSTWAEVQLDGIDAVDRPSTTQTAVDPLPQRVDRKSLLTIGCCASLLAAVFTWLGWQPVEESFAAKHWVSTPAIVQRVEVVKRRKQKPRLVVTYSYEVDGQQYTNDRYTISSGYSGRREFQKGQLKAKQPTTVWFDPADPQTAVIDRSFATFDLIIWLGAITLGFVGIGCLLYARFKPDNEMALKYDVATDSK